MTKLSGIGTPLASRLVSRGLLFAALTFGGSADAAPPRYHFELTHVTAKPSVKPAAAKAALPAVQDEVKKVFGEHPQLVALSGAPDPKASVDGYRAYLAKNHVSGAFNVSVEVTEATETLAPAADGQVLAVKIVLHMLGVNIADDTIGFNGHGNATVKQETSQKPSDADRAQAYRDAAEAVVAGAMKTAFEELAKPPKPKGKKK